MAYGATPVLHDLDLRRAQGRVPVAPRAFRVREDHHAEHHRRVPDATPRHGDARGRVVNDVPPYRRNTGMVFQSYALFPHMSVFDNVAFGLKVPALGAPPTSRDGCGRPWPWCSSRAGPAGDPRAVGGQQQQRVAIARAWPSTRGAPDGRAALQPGCSAPAADAGGGCGGFSARWHHTIFVTHDQEEALTLSDRLVVMNQGRIEQAGTPIELYRKPRTPFVAQFLGHPNFLFGTVARAAGQRPHGAGGDAPGAGLLRRRDRDRGARGRGAPGRERRDAPDAPARARQRTDGDIAYHPCTWGPARSRGCSWPTGSPAR